MISMHRSQRVLVALVALIMLVVSSSAMAGINTAWYDQNNNGNFKSTVFPMPGLPGDIGGISVRASITGSTVPVPLTNFTYTVQLAQMSSLQIDSDILSTAGLNIFNSLAVEIECPFGNTVLAPSFNLAANPNLATDTVHHYQSEVSMANGSWFAQPFNPNVLGRYTFLFRVETESGAFGQTMIVNVVPSSSCLVALSGLGGIARFGRRVRV